MEEKDFEVTDGRREPAASVHAKRVASYFDVHAQEWSDLYQRVRGINDVVLARRKDIAVDLLCQRLTPGRDVKILDAGCGAGVAALDLVRRGFYVHGIDVSQRMVALARERFAAEGIGSDRYTFTSLELLKSSFPPASFDGVVALGFLQYIPDEHQALRVLYDVLKPGGVLVVTGPNKSRISNYLGLSVFIEGIKGRLRGGTMFSLLKRAKATILGHAAVVNSSDRSLQDISPHLYSARRFRGLLTRAGFDMLHHEGHGFVGFPLRARLGFRGELFLHQSLSRLASVVPLGYWATDLVVLARKSH